MDKTRIAWLDISRGICILLMVICHACASAGGRWGWFNGATGTFFLVFFFASAGFCFNEKRSLGETVKRQFRKCLVPYLCISFVYICLLFHRNAIPGDNLINKVLNAIASLVWGLSNRFEIGPLQTVGMGPVWFLFVFFTSTIVFRAFGMKKFFGPIIFILVLLSSVSQSMVVLPFNVQNTVVGCMFIWIGYYIRQKKFAWFDRLYEMKAGWLLLLLMVSWGCTRFFADSGYRISTRFLNQYLDLGSNKYSLLSLPASLAGFATVVILGVIIDRSKILDEFLSLCGKESFLILIFHSIDITMIRNWTSKGIYFMLFTLLLYPFMVYLYRRTENRLKNCCYGSNN